MPALTATIANGATTSNAIDLGNGPTLMVGLIIPALTTSTAVTFTVADNSDGTFVTLYNSSGTQVSVTASASAARAVSLDAALFAAWRFIKCVVADAQSGAKDILVYVK